MFLRLSRLFKFQSKSDPKSDSKRSLQGDVLPYERILWGVDARHQPVLAASTAKNRRWEPCLNLGSFFCKPKKRKISFAALIFIALFLAHGLFAAEEPAKVFYPAASTPSTMASPLSAAPTNTAPVLTSVIYLVFLGAMGYVAYVLWRRKVVPQRTKAEKGATLDITTTRPLGNRQFLVVVRYKSKELLLGVGQGFITRLDESRMAPVNQNTDKESSPCKK